MSVQSGNARAVLSFLPEGAVGEGDLAVHVVVEHFDVLGDRRPPHRGGRSPRRGPIVKRTESR